MSSLKDDVKAYVESVLGLPIELKPARLKLPFHILDLYKPVQMQIDVGKDWISTLLLLPVSDEYPGAVALQKHITQVRKATDEVIVYVTKSLTPHERRSLISHQINFLQPGYQMFIPALAMDLREKVRQRRDEEEVQALLPAAQAMLLGCLYEGWSSEQLFTSNAIMGDFRYSRVTLSKVVDQLLTLKLLKVVKARGFKNLYAFDGNTFEIFRRARRYMSSPIRRKVAIDTKLQLGEGVFLAGETALAKYTMLAEPTKPVYGMNRRCFAELIENGSLRITDSVDDTSAWVEVWSYNSLAKNKNIADQASLLLSLEDNPDERIQISLDELKEQIAWLSSED
ncbi:MULTISPECIES: hypothetical protein [Pseudomonas]|uniref:MarR family transcriptional regulator n=1 Tax=Pseudomonas asplenii TaxID=53407 RepID=A0A0N0E5B2_9PSED|nr:hypothetical protein [Pseudomonas fuscovaginae]KPA92239.1 hypothetical protein PF66_00912 [Pseudomonas fuscovaginae]KPA94857.1 hypothetical protein PF70_05146 [Pseudomonas fuscovaginae]